MRLLTGLGLLSTLHPLSGLGGLGGLGGFGRRRALRRLSRLAFLASRCRGLGVLRLSSGVRLSLGIGLAGLLGCSLSLPLRLWLAIHAGCGSRWWPP